MQKIKVVHITTSLKLGGAEKILYDLLKNSDNKQFENYVVYFYKGPFAEKIQKLGVKTYQITGLICKYDPIFFLRLIFLIKKLKPDCIHSLLWSANVFANLAGLLLKIPIVSALHLATNQEKAFKNSFLRCLIDKIIFKIPKKIILVSKSMINDLPSSFPFKKIKIISNGIDNKNIYKLAKQSSITKECLGINKETFIVAYVARFIARKNHKLLIDAFEQFCKKVNNCRLILIGYGYLKEDLIEQCEKLNILNNVLFIEDEAYKLYKIFDCFVSTSINESFGLAILEAMSFNVPCIVAVENMRHDFLKNNVNCIMIDYNPSIIAEKLFDIYNNQNKMNEKLKKNGIITANKFDIKHMVKSYFTLFYEVSR